MGTTTDLRNGEVVTNSNVRFYCYRMFTYMRYGHLGRGNRIPIPACVQAKIHELYPDPNNRYVGFRAGRDEDDDDGSQSSSTETYGDEGVDVPDNMGETQAREASEGIDETSGELDTPH